MMVLLDRRVSRRGDFVDGWKDRQLAARIRRGCREAVLVYVLLRSKERAEKRKQR